MANRLRSPFYFSSKFAMLHYEFVPAEKASSHRLMVMLHGLGDSLEGYRWLPEVLNFPWLNYALVNAPDEYGRLLVV